MCEISGEGDEYEDVIDWDWPLRPPPQVEEEAGAEADVVAGEGATDGGAVAVSLLPPVLRASIYCSVLDVCSGINTAPKRLVDK